MFPIDLLFIFRDSPTCLFHDLNPPFMDPLPAHTIPALFLNPAGAGTYPPTASSKRRCPSSPIHQFTPSALQAAMREMQRQLQEAQAAAEQASRQLQEAEMQHQVGP